MAECVPFSKRTTAYFSLEFGIHESIRIFSGGLGVLAGDHLKAASDLNLPLAAVGLLYRQGYFMQVLDRTGWQIEHYPISEIQDLPLVRGCTPEGQEITITMKLNDREIAAAVWILWVGNVPLVLLDTELPQNPPDLREVTWRLYGGDKRMRLHQELLLGIGGMKALHALGCDPAVCHMNEGHAGFLSLERISYYVNELGYDPDTALEVVWRSNIFTTHTPVPAGNEVFDINLLRPYLANFAADAKLDLERIIRWGIPINERGRSGEMSMTVFGLRLAANYSNGVSKLHGEVAREMWKHLWPERSVAEIPIRHITNGVHIKSWTSNRIGELFDRYLTHVWSQNPDMKQLRAGLNAIPDEELWMTHELCRQSLIRHARRWAQNNFRYLVEGSSDGGNGRRRGEKGLLHMRVRRPRRGGDVSKTTQKRRSFLSCNLAEKERRWRCAGKTGPPRREKAPAENPDRRPARPPNDRDRLPARPQPSGAVWPRRPAPASLLERALWVPTTTNPFRPGPRREARKGKAQNERRNPE